MGGGGECVGGGIWDHVNGWIWQGEGEKKRKGRCRCHSALNPFLLSLSLSPLVVSANPTTKGGMQNGSSVETCARCMHVFARLAPILHARSVLINKTSASELIRKFVKSALLVGKLGNATCI